MPSAEIFKIDFSKNYFRNILNLICKSYQQMTQEGKEFKTLCMLGNFACRLLNFFKINVFKKILSGKQFGRFVGPDLQKFTR